MKMARPSNGRGRQRRIPDGKFPLHVPTPTKNTRSTPGKKRGRPKAVPAEGQGPGTQEDSSATATLIMEVAERLFAELGVEAVTLNRIVEESGQKNRSALHYHFGSRAELVTRLLHLRLAHINKIRHRYLDKLERSGNAHDVHALVRATVQPLVDVIRQEPWGSHYVRVLAQTTLSPTLRSSDVIDHAVWDGLQRARDMLRNALPDLPPPLVTSRFLLLQDTVVFTFARLVREHGKDALTAKAISLLVDFGAAGVAAPID